MLKWTISGSRARDELRRGIEMYKQIAAALLILICGTASAEIIEVKGIEIDFVTIGDAGNAADTSGYGSVSYDYRIGTYEISNSQWNQFTTAAGVPAGSGAGYSQDATWEGDNVAANQVSWLEALQFCNYLTSGDRSRGVYKFSDTGEYMGKESDAAVISGYGTVYALPTEDQWYKAAYYNIASGAYSLYANGTGTAPTTADSCYAADEPWDVGSGTQEQNGTYDMMGSMWEWTETESGDNIIIRGGSYYNYGNMTTYISSAFSIGVDNYIEQDTIGFRIVEMVPEPMTLILLGMGGLVIQKRSKYKNQK